MTQFVRSAFRLMAQVAFMFAIVFSLLNVAVACDFDTDCNPGSKCVKQNGQLHGVCAGGLFPGNNNDRKPVYAPLDINRTYGNTCSFDTDCGPSSACVKEPGSIKGTCLPKNAAKNIAKDRNACSFDTDCKFGYECVKQPGSIKGACSERENKNTLNRAARPASKGDTCSSNFDCKLGSICLKEDSDRFGVCVKPQQ
jgi:hypothetical protein